jgi:hypothetical protein
MSALRVEHFGDVVHLPPKGLDDDFTRRMVEAITVGLEPLGNSGRSATIYFIQEKNGVGLTVAFTNPGLFLATLTEMFGLGARILELSIAKAISVAFGLEPAPTSLDFAVKGAVRQYKPSREQRRA